MRIPRQPRDIIWVDDDQYFIQPFLQAIREAGFAVLYEPNATLGLDVFNRRQSTVCAVILDLAMPPGQDFEMIETHGGHLSGLALARNIHNINRNVPIVAFTQQYNEYAKGWFLDKSFPYIIKSMTTVHEFADRVQAVIDPQYRPYIETFIVHGHDDLVLSELKDYIRNDLKIGDPIVLRDQPHCGKTIIEKFEEYAEKVSIVFVILTPDDPGIVNNESSRRTRQNVVFELGYFFGRLQRREGRVILLHKGDLELPSDIAGIGYIDVTHGIRNAEERIKIELLNWLGVWG